MICVFIFYGEASWFWIDSQTHSLKIEHWITTKNHKALLPAASWELSAVFLNSRFIARKMFKGGG